MSQYFKDVIWKKEQTKKAAGQNEDMKKPITCILTKAAAKTYLKCLIGQVKPGWDLSAQVHWTESAQFQAWEVLCIFVSFCQSAF